MVRCMLSNVLLSITLLMEMIENSPSSVVVFNWAMREDLSPLLMKARPSNGEEGRKLGTEMVKKDAIYCLSSSSTHYSFINFAIYFVLQLAHSGLLDANHNYDLTI
jgi:hypothetical protein